MKYIKFIINGYRAVANTEVRINQNRLIPIIGINESGKTSILQAILSFDANKDRSNGGRHLVYKNRYVTKKEPCSINAEIGFESLEEINEFVSRFNPKDKIALQAVLESAFNKKKPFTVTRDLETKKYSFTGVEIDEGLHKKFIREVHSSLPFILYFDDFSDRVPQEIKFSGSYSGPKSLSGVSQRAEWQKLIEEIFLRSGEFSLYDFTQITDANDRNGLLSDVNDILNETIMEDWKQLKKKSSSLADDDGDLELTLDYGEYDDDDDTFSFVFKVIDRSSSKSRHFDITERSKGFQWFFNFAIKLKFNAKYKNNIHGAIYLLDEPGSYLHASAQEELLKELKVISNTNTIFYCTHSQHLLDPDIINIASIRISDRDNGAIKLKEFSKVGTSNARGALTPLYDALRMRIGSLNYASNKVVITEGITDYYFFNLLSKYSEILNGVSCVFVPGAGAGHLKDLISLAIATSDKYLVMLDCDDAGKCAYKKYKKYFGDEQSKNIVYYGKSDTDAAFELENYLCKVDKKKLLDLVDVKDVKSGIIKLFFCDEGIKEDFIKNMNSETLLNLKRISSIINSL